MGYRPARDTRTNFNRRIFLFHLWNFTHDEIDGKRNVDPASWRSLLRAHSRKMQLRDNKYHVLLLASLLSAWAGLAMTGCCKGDDQSAQQQRDSTARLVEAYLSCYKKGGFEKIPFTADVTFEGPLTHGKIVGKPAVQKFLSTVHAKDIRVARQIIDGQFACVLADFETTEGTIVPFCEFFRIRNGEIAEIRPYFDPRPFIR